MQYFSLKVSIESGYLEKIKAKSVLSLLLPNYGHGEQSYEGSGAYKSLRSRCLCQRILGVLWLLVLTRLVRFRVGVRLRFFSNLHYLFASSNCLQNLLVISLSLWVFFFFFLYFFLFYVFPFESFPSESRAAKCKPLCQKPVTTSTKCSGNFIYELDPSLKKFTSTYKLVVEENAEIS